MDKKYLKNGLYIGDEPVYSLYRDWVNSKIIHGSLDRAPLPLCGEQLASSFAAGRFEL